MDTLISTEAMCDNILPGYGATATSHSVLHQLSSKHDIFLPRHSIPINLLPAELLGEIFDCCSCSVDDEGRVASSFGITQHTAPWVISHVCTFWRETAMQYSRLWSRPFINLEREDHIQKLACHLERARGFDIDIHMHARRVPHIVDSLLQIVLSTSQRWRRLSIDCPIAIFRPIAHLSVPRLVVLDVTLFPIPITATSALITTFAHAPALRSLIVSHSIQTLYHSHANTQQRSSSPLMNVFSLPWSQIERITTDRDGALYLDPRLGVGAGAKGLEFTFIPCRWAYHTYLRGTTLRPCTSLCEMEIFAPTPMSCSSYAFHLFEALDFPNLRKVRIVPPFDYREAVMPVFTPTTAPRLKYLEVDFSKRKCSFGLEMMVGCFLALRCLPDLEDLRVAARVQETVLQQFRRHLSDGTDIRGPRVIVMHDDERLLNGFLRVQAV